MVMALSCGIVVLGIYIYTVSASSASNRCSDLINSCLHKFQQLNNNPLCGELRDAINCLNASDIAVCDFSAAAPTTEAVENETNEHVNSNSELDQRGRTRTSTAGIKGNNAIINTKTSQNGADSNGESDSQSGQMKGSVESNVDYIVKLIDVIEEAKEEYKRDCNVNNMGSSASAATWSAIILFIGVFAAVNM